MIFLELCFYQCFIDMWSKMVGFEVTWHLIWRQNQWNQQTILEFWFQTLCFTCIPLKESRKFDNKQRESLSKILLLHQLRNRWPKSFFIYIFNEQLRLDSQRDA